MDLVLRTEGGFNPYLLVQMKTRVLEIVIYTLVHSKSIIWVSQRHLSFSLRLRFRDVSNISKLQTRVVITWTTTNWRPPHHGGFDGGHLHFYCWNDRTTLHTHSLDTFKETLRVVRSFTGTRRLRGPLIPHIPENPSFRMSAKMATKRNNQQVQQAIWTATTTQTTVMRHISRYSRRNTLAASNKSNPNTSTTVRTENHRDPQTTWYQAFFCPREPHPLGKSVIVTLSNNMLAPIKRVPAAFMEKRKSNSSKKNKNYSCCFLAISISRRCETTILWHTDKHLTLSPRRVSQHNFSCFQVPTMFYMEFWDTLKGFQWTFDGHL